MRSLRFRASLLIGLGTFALVALLVGLAAAHDLDPAIAAQERHTEWLLRLPDVVGTAVGLTAEGHPAIKVYTKAAGAGGIPDRLEGIPVVVEATGEFLALPGNGKAGKGGGGSGSGLTTTSTWPPPVPIGVSTGNIGQCSAGTISARVIGGTAVYALSNNHVYALENSAPLGSEILQPGLYDTNCTMTTTNNLGTLYDYEPIVFSTSANNTIDAAIARSSTAVLGDRTPPNGYGVPNSATVAASVGQAVQKYGRTTQLTHGVVTGINATVLVGYSSGTARFVSQIVVGSSKPFIKPGDSGSLLVTNDSNLNPAGLLFAGTSSGTTAIANPIGLVLSRFNVTVDNR